jgi:hypothetical protein
MSPAPAPWRRLARPWAPLAALVGCLAGPLACGRAAAERRPEAPPAADGRLFTRLPSRYTGVRFENRLVETAEMNVFTYRNFYNGGGVAVGDLTGDGLPELVLTANAGGPRLYVNEGTFRFRDATAAAGVTSERGAWTTGVTMADVNGDGRLDVYVCKAGPGGPETRANELWLNRGAGAGGTPRFEEVARAYGVADEGWSTQAAFLDYDRDGDLDLLVVNNSPKPVAGFAVFYTRLTTSRYGGAKLYRNDAAPGRAPRFAEVTGPAGIYSPEVAFGLGVAVGDVNRDGWPDVYVANDFFERDYLYVNRGDGTFSEQLDRQAPVLSYFSMGLDVADLDNDGWPDVYTTDMLPEHQGRLRTMAAFEGWDVYQAKVRNGYHHQVMRNTLQRNNGDGTFSDVAWQAGAARTDWSWGALAADLDLDGRKDVFVTNGLARDVTSQDYIAFVANDQQASRRAAGAGAPRPAARPAARGVTAARTTSRSRGRCRRRRSPTTRSATSAAPARRRSPTTRARGGSTRRASRAAPRTGTSTATARPTSWSTTSTARPSSTATTPARCTATATPSRSRSPAPAATASAWGRASRCAPAARRWCRSRRPRAASSRASTRCSPSGSAPRPRPTPSSWSGPTAARAPSRTSRPTGA